MWGIRAFFLLLSCGMWGISAGFVLIKMAVIIPTRTSGNISAHGSGHKCSQVFVESVVLLCKSIQGKRFNIEVPIIFCSAAP